MAPVKWSDLPPGVVDVIAKLLLDSDIDLLRLRSVCSSWRSSVIPRPRNPFCFPLQVPPICNNPPEIRVFDGKKVYYNLYEDTLYRLSPPPNANQVCDDTSNDWMLKLSETSPNIYTLLKPFSTDEIDYPPGTIPKCLNLIDCRVSEICKSYRLAYKHREGTPGRDVVVFGVVKKVIILWDYVVDCNFAALAVYEDEGRMSYWKLGDENWSPVDTKGHNIHDVILYDGKCYAIDSVGVLVSLDNKMQLTVVASSDNNLGGQPSNVLLECKSSLYLVSMDYCLRREFYTDRANQKRVVNLALVVSKFNKCSGSWDCVENLGDNVFLLGEDVSVAVSAKDFEGFKGNSVYLTDYSFIDDSRSEVYGHVAGIYNLDNPRALTIGRRDSWELNLHPPSWLISSASSSEP